MQALATKMTEELEYLKHTAVSTNTVVRILYTCVNLCHNSVQNFHRMKHFIYFIVNFSNNLTASYFFNIINKETNLDMLPKDRKKEKQNLACWKMLRYKKHTSFIVLIDANVVNSH